MKGMHHQSNKVPEESSFKFCIIHCHLLYLSKRGNNVQRGEIQLVTFTYIKGSKNPQKKFHYVTMEYHPHHTQCVLLLVNDNKKLMPYFAF